MIVGCRRRGSRLLFLIECQAESEAAQLIEEPLIGRVGKPLLQTLGNFFADSKNCGDAVRCATRRLIQVVCIGKSSGNRLGVDVSNVMDAEAVQLFGPSLRERDASKA